MNIGMERENLEKFLRKAIYEINLNKELMEKALKDLLNKGYKVGDAQQTLNGGVALEFLDLIDLGVLTDILYRVTSIESINPKTYFTDLELKNIKEFKMKNADESDDMIEYPLVFKDVFQQTADQWIGVISIQQVVNLLHAKKIRYNYQTQRNPLFIKHKDTIIQRPNVNKNSVKQIAEKILSKQLIPDALTFNIFADGAESFSYDEKNKILILNEGNLDMLDGMHRSLGASSALLTNPNIELNFGLQLTNFDVDKANRYILQKDLRNPLDVEYKTSLDTSNLNNSVVKTINENTESDIRGLIVTDNALITTGKALTLFSIMSNTIAKLWNIKIRKDAKELSDYLISFFNELIGIYPNELKLEIKKNKKNNFMAHPNMIIYYLVIAKELQDKADWQNLLYNIVTSTDFSTSNVEWEGKIIGVYQRNFNRKIAQIIKAYQHKVRGV